MKRIIVPSIAEINAMAGSNGMKVVSTFAGCGGSSTGYKWAGFSVPVAVEFVDKAADTYRANAPSTTVLQEDVRQITAERIMELAGVDVGELDVLDGSPPCQTFSNAGLKDKAWGKEKQYSGTITQRTDDLFFEFIRLLRGLKPRAFVAENVSGLVQGVALGYFKEIHQAFVDCGYRVEARLVKADRLGVPQKRHRVIFIGVRNDLRRSPVYPTMLPESQYVSLREAIEDLPPPQPGEYEALKEGTRTRMAWEYTDVLRDPQGCFRYAYQRLFNKDARYMWFKLPPHQPCLTVTAKVACLTHWAEPRTLSIPEIVRVSSFPDDFALPGKFSHRWERIGRSVPPLMMKRIAETLAENVLKKPIRPHYRLVGGEFVRVN